LRTKFTVSRHPDGSLCLAEPAGSRLRRWIERSAVPERSIGGVTRTLCPDGRPALTVVLAPIRTLPMSWLGIDPRWLVFLFDANRPAVADPGQLAGELGLTAREADIAMLLASGEKLPDIARRLDISVHTARVHLKHLFEKTSARSQANLVRQILASASAMLARPR
jgi:DNA-binding CsgD family transcriptional regulator